MKKIFIGISLMLLPMMLVAGDFSLTIYNGTPANFYATTVGGQYLGYVPNKGQKTILSVPFVPSFPTYAVLLEGDNGNNAAVIDDGSYPYCSDQLTYHQCAFSDIGPFTTTVKISQ